MQNYECGNKHDLVTAPKMELPASHLGFSQLTS